MSGILNTVVEIGTFGLVDDITGSEKAADKAQATSLEASQLQADYQQQALDYLKQQEQLPSEIREAGLTELAGAYGLEGYDSGTQIGLDQGQLVQQAQESDLYKALLGGQAAGEESILRQAGATGGLRSGNVQSALADYSTQLQNQALLQSYGEQSALEQYNQQQQLGGLQSLAGLQSYAPEIAQQTGQIGQTLGSGIVGGAQSAAAAEAAKTQELMAIGQVGLQAVGAFSDVRLKDNVKYQGIENGYPVYTWTWNEQANKLGLVGEGRGVMADDVAEINPDAIIDGEYLKVNYEMIGVKNA